jgi:hypothetical protein
MAPKTSFSLMRKQTPFQKHKDAEETKRKVTPCAPRALDTGLRLYHRQNASLPIGKRSCQIVHP